MKHCLIVFFFLFGMSVFSQDVSEIYRSIKVAVQDTIAVDSTSISPLHFELFGKNGVAIDTSKYHVNFAKGEVYLAIEIKEVEDSLTINYVKYPSFLTKKYSLLDTKIISADNSAMDKFYSLQQPTRENTFKPFDGLNTSGSISRGITIGNNQNAVINSQLDLQITGKISDKVSIRASIQDANIPIQEGGYSQSLDEFDQIFIELYSDAWNIRAGDIDLENRTSYFAKFQKKAQGIAMGGKIKKENSETTMFASGAVVKGVFSKSTFVGQEGNQGPYKLIGPNGELFILIISGSERVFVNGLLLERGENNEYVIDYNAGELKFNPTYPITADMRILVEYQYSDRNYTRFIGYSGGNYTSEKLDLGVYGYLESDAKNQPLQQNLSEEQVLILQQAGDDKTQMIAPSAVADTFSENKILYRKEIFNGEEIFVFSNNPEDELFQVRFSLVGENQGDYILTNTAAISRIFEFISPINGIPQGNYAPVIQLFAPTTIQVAGVNGSYRPSEKTTLGFEVAASKQDLNLFSNIDNEDNNGFATRLQTKQRILQKEHGLQLDAYLNFDYVDKNFHTIERLYTIEFDRDWSLNSPEGNQSFWIAGLQLADPTLGFTNYEFQKLDYSEGFNGVRHVVNSGIQLGKLKTDVNTSILNNSGTTVSADFFRFYGRSVYGFEKSWLGVKVAAEDNKQRFVANDSLTPISQKFKSYELFTGLGDSTNVFVEVGYRNRINDSLRNAHLQKVSSSNTIYLKSQLLNSENTQLSVFANYRTLKDAFSQREKEQSLNSRILYNQRFFKGGIQWNTTFETNSGVLPQQEFTFVQVEPGQGTHTWIDYNSNGIQELEEFEIAQFADEGIFIRVLLPNQVFVKIHQNKFGQVVTLQPHFFSKNEKRKNVLSKFYNQTSYLIDRKTRREGGNFDINPFVSNTENQLGLNLNFRNILFFNRGKQRYTTSYTYTTSNSENLLSVGLQKNRLLSHQLQFTHKFATSWLGNFKTQVGENAINSENFESRNFTIKSYDLAPKISYLVSENAQFSVFYTFTNKENAIGEKEVLDQQTLGTSFTYNNAEKFSINGEFNFISNDFSGSAFSPVAFQMLEGLQPDKNFTWSLLFQKKITQYLDANLSYFGRKSETSSTIHTGSIQLKAYF
ncbi:MAG: hypothetical protein CVU03_05190 [Bacteroidetes bacterium HGW-Bacteroidetes-2]|jgi:hypothetical protein|nr:MAG: hypothetical protein CVU03_05190 [Bacteroidetes bacterium HGW-Bacteroidetes-2]